MPRTKSLTQYQMQPLDTDLFHDLFDILHETIFNSNWAATARSLYSSTSTVRRWNTHPPSQGYWNILLREVIREMARQMRNSPVKKHRIRAASAISQLSRHGFKDLAIQLELDDATADGAAHYLLRLVSSQPKRRISSKQLKQPAFSGGYSFRALRQAAVTLTLDKRTKGFGKDKETIYSLP